MEQSTAGSQTTSRGLASATGRGGAWRGVGLFALAGLAAVLGGCEADNYLDPSIVGRWEKTPTVVPILSRLSAIEGPEEVFVEYSPVQTSDLVPEVSEYRVGPGDVLQVSVFNLVRSGQPELLERRVDSRGYIEIPQAGSVYIDGMTLEGVRNSIREAVRPITGETNVDVLVAREQQRTFNVMGMVQGQGPYFVPYADYRLIDALAAAGGFVESVEFIYVIRQVPLSDEAAGRLRSRVPSGSSAPSGTGTPPAGGDQLIDIIDELLTPSGRPTGGSPGVFAGAGERTGQPSAARLPVDLIEALPAQPGTSTSLPQVGDLPSSTGQWLYLDGEWVLVSREGGGGVGGVGETTLFTQRVIRIPVKPLVAGDARYNIVIRPNDIVRVPPPPQGNIFLAGQVARPGTFDLAQGLTLQRAIYAAGGLAPLAVPERTDLIRMVGPNQQATIRVNLRAITEGSQPDVFLKDNDVINVGTNFWAYPLAVMRSGFRASYGFGLLIDRNFGNDIFGPPPDSNRF